MNATPLLLVGRGMLDADDRAAAEPSSAATPARAAALGLLEEVWRACEPRLAKFGLGLGLRSDQVADVLQEVFIAAMQNLPEVTTDVELTRWLFQVTVNRCRLEHRRAGRRRRLWSALVSVWRGSHSADKQPFHGELKAEVHRALAMLADLDRSLVVLRYFADLNSREIGEITNMPESTVRSRLRAARHKLALELSERNETD